MVPAMHASTLSQRRHTASFHVFRLFDLWLRSEAAEGAITYHTVLWLFAPSPGDVRHAKDHPGKGRKAEAVAKRIAADEAGAWTYATQVVHELGASIIAASGGAYDIVMTSEGFTMARKASTANDDSSSGKKLGTPAVPQSRTPKVGEQ